MHACQEVKNYIEYAMFWFWMEGKRGGIFKSSEKWHRENYIS